MTTPTIDDHGRPEPPLRADEAATLLGFLDFQRATLAWKTQGLSADALRVRLPGHPSGMTLAGLVKHLAWVEDYWFTEVMSGATMPSPWADVDWEADDDWEWHSAIHDSPEELQELWQACVARSRAVVAEALDDPSGGGAAAGAAPGEPLDVSSPNSVEALARTYAAWGGQDHVSGRWILTHMIEEYARHNGHADLLRELADGETGE